MHQLKGQPCNVMMCSEQGVIPCLSVVTVYSVHRDSNECVVPCTAMSTLGIYKHTPEHTLTQSVYISAV